MYAFLNKYVFKSLLKLSTDLASRIYEGKEFQSVGATEANDRSPNMAKVFTEGGSRRTSLFDLIL
jgi:hypothetical protein